MLPARPGAAPGSLPGPAGRAATVELDAMVRDGESRPSGHPPVEGRVHRLGEVVDPSALGASEVVMDARVAVEPRPPGVASRRRGQLLDEAFVYQEPRSEERRVGKECRL